MAAGRILSRAVSLLLIPSLVAPSLVANAAPPVAPPVDPEACDCEEEPSVDECRRVSARWLNDRGTAKYKEGDFAGAIELLEQAMPLLPEGRRGGVGVPLAYAHRRAYEADGDVEHLRKARALFAEHLETLDSSDEDARGSIEAELASIDVELTTIAAQNAKAEAEREEQIRLEQVALSEQALLEVETTHATKVRKIFLGVGGSLMVLGAGSFGAMAANLAWGDKLDRDGQALALTTGSAENPYHALLARGRGYNQAAWTTGAIGGSLMAAGVVLLVIEAVRHDARKKSEYAQRRPRVELQGLELRF